MSNVVPFPINRRVAFIARIASRMAELTPHGAEKHLEQQIRVQADTMVRRGISPDAVEREISGMRGAARGALWSLVMAKGGTA